MPAPSIRNQGAFNASAASFTVDLPAHEIDDILLVVVTTANQLLPAANTFLSNGYQLVPNLPDGSGSAGAAGGLRMFIYWTRATSAAQTAPVTGDSGSYQSAWAYAIQNCITTGQPFETPANSQQLTASTTLTCPSITTTNANTRVYYAIGMDSDQNNTGPITLISNANLTGILNHGGNLSNAGAGGGSALQSGRKITAGAVGTATATITSTIYHTWVAAFVGTPDAAPKPRTQTIMI